MVHHTHLSAHKGKGYQGKQLWSNYDAIQLCALKDWGKSQKKICQDTLCPSHGCKHFLKL